MPNNKIWKKALVVGILVCTLLITIAVLPASANIIPEEDGNKENLSPYAIIFINAKIDNLTEEIIDEEVHYSFHANSIRMLWFQYLPPIYFYFERIYEEDIETGFKKSDFIGHIDDSSVFGIVFGPCV